jgi:hypothetical protein
MVDINHKFHMHYIVDDFKSIIVEKDEISFI